MKNFIGGVVFGIFAVPVISYAVQIAETAANLVVTKLSVIMAKDAAELENDGTSVTSAIGFCAPDDNYEEDEE